RDVVRGLNRALGEGECETVRGDRPIDGREGGEANKQNSGPTEQRPFRRRRGGTFDRPRSTPEQKGGGGAERGNRQQSRNAVNEVQQRERAEAAGGGAREVAAVDETDRPRAARERERNAHAGEHVGWQQRGDQLEPQHRREEDSDRSVEQHGRYQN